MNLHEDVFELLGAYALGALEEAEAALVQAHVRECEVCQKELAGFAEVTTRLEHLGPVQPPPELRGRVLAAVRQEANDRAAPRRTPLRLRPQWLWASAFVVLLAVQVWLLRELALQRRIIEQQQQVQTVLLSANEAPIDMVSPDPASPAYGYYRAEPELQMGLLNYYHLPPPSLGQSYQCWFEVADESAVACGALPLDEDGHGVLLVTLPEHWPDRIRVTVEENSVSTPTGSTLLIGEFNWDQD
jgi:hypothetical protein